jgi:dipeptidyl aminopeptidase/acylaminoacyl peptidase
MGELFFAAFFAPEAPPSEPELLHVPVDELGRLTSSPAPFTWTPLGDARMTVGRLSVSPSGTYLTSAYDTEIGESVIVVDLLTAQQTAYVYGGRLFNWHPNDHEFLFAAQEAETDPGLWLVEVSTGEYRLLAQPAALSYANLSGAAISPDGQVLAYSIIGPDIAQIWLSNADGSEPRMVLDSNTTAIVHSWSPDGCHLLYSGEPRPEVGKMTPLPPQPPLWVMSREGKDRRPLNILGESLGTISDPVWSPTGQYIAAVGDTSDAPHCQEGGMTPSADRLCPFRSRSVYVEDVGTGEVWLAAQDAIDPTWSPDGSMLAVAKMDESDQVDIWLVSIADRSLHRITDTPELDRYPIWLKPR